MTNFTRQWNPSYEGSPSDSDFISEGATRIRETRGDVAERLRVDHSLAGDANDGLHEKVTLLAQPSDPSPVGGSGILYTKDVGGVIQLFYKDADGNITQVLPLPDFSGDIAALQAADVTQTQSIATNTADIAAINGKLPHVGQSALVQLTRSAGVAGPQWALNTWQSVNFNTLSNNADNIVALTSGRIQPVAGTYLLMSSILAAANGGAGVQGRTRLWNHTTSTQICQGNNVVIPDSGNVGAAASNLSFVLTANGTDEFEVQIYVVGAIQPISAMGSGTEIYGTLSLVRIVA